MDNIDQALKKYIDQILRINQKKELSQENLNDIVMELGISSEELEAIKQKIDDHYSQARGYFNNQLYDQAAQSLEEVIKAAPFHYDLHALGAEIYSRLYAANGGLAHKIRAQELAKQAIDINPQPQSPYQILNILNKPIKHRKDPFRLGLVLFGVLGVLFFLGFLFLFPQDESDLLQKETPKMSEALEPAELIELEDLQTDEYSETIQSVYPETGDYEIPIIFTEDFTARGISLDATALLSRYIDSFSLRVKGRLGAIDQEIQQCQLKVELLYQNRKIFESAILKALADYEPDIRPGFVNAFEYLSYQDSLPESEVMVRISIHILESFAAPKKYPPLGTEPIQWKVTQSSGYDLIAKLREENRVSYFDDISSRITIELENIGTRRINGLILLCEWYDVQNHLLESEKTYAAVSNEPPFLPEEKRAVSFWATLGVEESRDLNFKIAVIEIQ